MEPPDLIDMETVFDNLSLDEIQIISNSPECPSYYDDVPVEGECFNHCLQR